MKKDFSVYLMKNNNDCEETPDVSALIDYITLEILNKKLRFSKEDITRRAEEIANELKVFCIPERMFACVANRLQWFEV